jgi:membrane protease YdiL (CAAX protease family)
MEERNMTETEISEQERAELNKQEETLSSNKESIESEIDEELVEKKKLGMTWPHFLLFFLFFIGASVVIGIPVGIYDAITEQGIVELLFTGYNALLFDAFIFMVILISYKRVRKFVFESLNLTPLRSWKTYGYILVGLAILYSTQYLMFDLFSIEDPSQQPDQLGVNNLGGHWFNYLLFYLAVVVFTPLKEELLYRGIIHRFLEVRHHFWIGIIVSSLIFGVLHLGFPITATLMGVVFVILYKLTKSIVPSMILHMLWNAYAAILFALQV